jgi:DNA-binding transcriptional regulator YdaS (Cro superfamily)
MDIENNLFTKLGGTRKMADLLGEAPSTVQSWKSAGRIPAHKQPLVIERAKAAGVEVTADEVVFPFGQEQAA